LLGGPSTGLLRTWVELRDADPVYGSPVVIARNTKILWELHQATYALLRTGTIPHHISQAPYAVNGVHADIRQDRIQRSKIPVYVRHD
jgi:hypothetical protein